MFASVSNRVREHAILPSGFVQMIWSIPLVVLVQWNCDYSFVTFNETVESQRVRGVRSLPLSELMFLSQFLDLFQCGCLVASYRHVWWWIWSTHMRMSIFQSLFSRALWFCLHVGTHTGVLLDVPRLSLRDAWQYKQKDLVNSLWIRNDLNTART